MFSSPEMPFGIPSPCPDKDFVYKRHLSNCTSFPCRMNQDEMVMALGTAYHLLPSDVLGTAGACLMSSIGPVTLNETTDNKTDFTIG